MPKGVIALIFLVLGIVLFIFILRNVGISGVTESLAVLSGPESILVLIILFFGQIVIGALKWKTIIGETKDSGLKFSTILVGRWAGFGGSFLTPSAWFGGEPIRFLVLKQGSKLSSSRIISSIILDELIFVLVCSVYFFIGIFFLLTYLHLSWLKEIILWGLFLVAILLFWFLLRRARVISSEKGVFISLAERFYLNKLKIVKKNQDKINGIEADIRDFFKSPRLLKAAGFAALEGAFIIFAYWLIMFFAGSCLEIPKLLAIKSMADVSYSFPFPAGLGTLEISQAFVFRVLGFSLATGVAFGLIIRGLNLIIAFSGIGIFGCMQIKFVGRKIVKFFLAFFPEENKR